jgi:hypothetical protein
MLTFNSGGRVQLLGSNASLSINSTTYTLIHSVADLLNINTNLAGNYALAQPIDMGGNTYTQSPIAPWINGPDVFTGNFNGLNNTIKNLKINVTNLSETSIGLFGAIGTQPPIPSEPCPTSALMAAASSTTPSATFFPSAAGRQQFGNADQRLVIGQSVEQPVRSRSGRIGRLQLGHDQRRLCQRHRHRHRPQQLGRGLVGLTRRQHHQLAPMLTGLRCTAVPEPAARSAAPVVVATPAGLWASMEAPVATSMPTGVGHGRCQHISRRLDGENAPASGGGTKCTGMPRPPVICTDRGAQGSA